MLQDALNLLSNAQLITKTAASTNYIDTLAAGNGIAPGARVRVSVPVSITSGNATGTLKIALQTSAYSAFNSYTTLAETAALAQTALVAGSVPMDLVIPAGALRYLRLYFTVATEDMTAGSVDAGIVLDSDVGQDK